ncbi:MAG: cation diffusion facilitator family transporter [Alphaproteobacteria bacterium]|nr:cation diffusion facilitator family transporter [Alphaproteobacteria bacterium]
MAHSHSHHSHSHGPGRKDFGWAFAVGIALNLGFVGVEAAYGLISHSMALLADAGHNLADVLGLATAWAAAILSKRPPTKRFSYGLRASSILAALANSIVLIVAVALIAYHAIVRLIIPDIVAGKTVMIVAAIGIVINALTALMFARGRRSDLNVRGAYLHMVTDALVSAGVVVAGIAIQLTGWLWIDPVTSLVVAALIFLVGTDLLRDSVTMALAGVPGSIDPNDVEAHLVGLPGVARIHDLHIWPMSTTEFALTAHLVIPAGFPGDKFLADCAHAIEHRFGITHSTLQIEIGGDCELEPIERV